jgi:cell division protease FtsH
MDLKRFFRGPLFWIVIAFLGVLVIGQLLTGQSGYKSEPTGRVVQLIQQGSDIKNVTLIDPDQEIRIEKKDGTKVRAHWVDGQANGLNTQLQTLFTSNRIEKYNVENPKPSFIGQVFSTLIPFLLIAVVFIFLMNSMQGGGSRVMSFAKSKAKLVTKDTPKTTFADVAGADEAIEELGEIKEFLQEPGKFQAVGAKIPKGVLLYGQPGTGKTLLARAVAARRGCRSTRSPALTSSRCSSASAPPGCGTCSSRPRPTRRRSCSSTRSTPSAGNRGAGLGGGHDEREQTLNQLLVEMDGFDVRGGVILIAATNRPDVLDPALLRPGRFDRQIAVDAPDLPGREQILKVHARGKPMSEDADLRAVARRTPGFTGADLANVLNEAALLTARLSKTQIDKNALDEAIDRRHRRTAAPDPADERQGEGAHRLPRGRPRAGRRGAAALGPGAQGNHPAARPRAGLHHGAPGRGQVLDHPVGDAGQAGLHARWPRRRGDGLPRPDHRRQQRHREGDRAGPRDGHPVRHDRAARRDQVRPGLR